MSNINEFLNNLDELFKKAKFKEIKPDKSNIDEVFFANLSTWYYFNSDSVKKKDGTKKISSKIDTINNIKLKDPENFIFCKTKDGFDLTENDFINAELKILNTINKFTISEHKQFEIYKEYLLNKLQQPQQIGTNKGFENTHWFKIGLLFANGKMTELLKANEHNSTKVAELLGNKNYRPFISESIGFNKESDKNIFNSFDKMNKIISYCKEQNIDIIPEFLNRLPIE